MTNGLLDFDLKLIDKKKRNTLTPAQRIWVWERPKMYGRTCNICKERITKLSDLEFDHTKAHSKGGKTQALAHKECNRVKGRGSLKKIQKTLGIASKRKHMDRRKKSKRKSQKRQIRDNSIAGVLRAQEKISKEMFRF